MELNYMSSFQEWTRQFGLEGDCLEVVAPFRWSIGFRRTAILVRRCERVLRCRAFD